ncbi:hypothetical protein G6F40_017820 [Rhizopus arrhizus]|nr:hypothetical protein G6F40_017820 [Rhizopus arrhizus]
MTLKGSWATPGTVSRRTLMPWASMLLASASLRWMRLSPCSSAPGILSLLSRGMVISQVAVSSVPTRVCTATSRMASISMVRPKRAGTSRTPTHQA